MSEENPNTDPDPNTDPPADGAWLESLPDDLKGSKSLSSYKNVEALARSHVEVQPLIGSKLIMPDDKTSDEDRNSFYNQLGRPETAEGYQSPADGLPEGFEINEEQQKAFFEHAHKHGFTADQAAGMVRFQAIQMASAAKAQQDQYGVDEADAVEALKKEWGGSYEEKMALATGAVKKFGGQELVDAMNETGLGNNLAMNKAFAAIGKAIAEDEILGAGAGRQFISSPAEADAKISALRGDKDFMERFHSKSPSIRKPAVAEMAALMEIKFPNTRKA